MAAEDAGTISAKIRLELDAMQKDALQAQKMMENYARQFARQGEEGGKLYVKGFGKSQLELNKKLNEMVSSFRGVSPQMGAFGEKLAGVFSKPIFAMVPAVSTAFQAMLPVIGTVLAAVAFLAKGIQKAVAAHKEKVEAMKLSQKVSQQLKDITYDLANANIEVSGTMRELSREAAAYYKVAQAQQEVKKSAAELRQEYNNLTEEQRSTTEAYELYVQMRQREYEEPRELAKSIKETKEALEEAKKTLKELTAEQDKTNGNHLKQLGAINAAEKAGAKTALEARQAELSAVQSYIDSLIEARTVAAALKGEDAAKRVVEIDQAIAGLVRQKHGLSAMVREMDALSSSAQSFQDLMRGYAEIRAAEIAGEGDEESRNREKLVLLERRINNLISERVVLARTAGLDRGEKLGELDAEIKAQQKLRDELTKLINDKDRQARIDAARKNADTTYANTERKARQDKALGLIDEIELTRRLQDAEIARYNAYEDIIAQEKLSAGYTVSETENYRKQTAEIIKARKELENQEKINALITSHEDEKTRQLIAQTKARAGNAETVEEQNELLAEAVKLENALMLRQRKRAWDAIAQSDEYKAASESTKQKILADFNAITDGMMKVVDNSKAVSVDIRQYVQQAFDFGSSLYRLLSDAYVENIQRETDELKKQLDERTEDRRKALEDEMEAQLVAANFTVDGNRQCLEDQLEAAKRTGDELLIYQKQRALERYQIETDYNEKVEALEKEAADEAARLEYQAARAEWQNKMIASVVDTASAMISAAAGTPGPWWAKLIAAGAAQTLGHIQTGIIAANPPTPPKFEHGGIVPGNSFSGDKVPALVNSGELILNRAHQDSIARQLGAGENKPVTATVVVMMDTREIAKSTVDLVNDGFYTIKARALR